MPLGVLLPENTAQVQAILKLCHANKIPFVARGSGTGLSGGALPIDNGIVIALTRMNRILEIDIPNARVVVEPGVINLDVNTRPAVLPQEYFYAPDPSSQSGLQHRRQRRRKFRRRALPQVRIHYDARSWSRSCFA